MRTFRILLMLLFLCSCAESAEGKKPNIQTSGAEILSVSANGEFAVLGLWQVAGENIILAWELVRVTSLEENRYEIIDTLPGEQDSFGFCSDSVVYWMPHENGRSRLLMRHVSEPGSLIVVIEKEFTDTVKYPGFDLHTLSYFHLKDSLMSTRTGLWRLRSDGSVVSILQLENRGFDAFSLDGLEYLFELDPERWSQNPRHWDVYSYNITDSVLKLEYSQNIHSPGSMTTRGIGKPIFFLDYSLELQSLNVFEFDRLTREKKRLTDLKPPKRVVGFDLLRNSILVHVSNSDKQEECMIIDR